MFFIMGISQKQKKLEFNQMSLCTCCDRYGQIEIMMTYSYLMLFFIPVFKWGKRYYAVMKCCQSSVEIDPKVGREIETGDRNELDVEYLRMMCHKSSNRICGHCGARLEAEFDYCPKCGSHASF